MDNLQKNFATYAIYFEDLRRRIFLLIKIFIVVFAFGFFATPPAIKFILNYLNTDDITITTTSPFQLINLAMSIGFFFACAVIVPILVFHLYSFFKPGLLRKERRIFFLSLPISFGLFILGFSYSAGMLYYAIQFIAKVNISLGIVNYWDISLFISEIVMTSSLLGLLFIFPLFTTILIRLGLLSVDFLKSKRRHAVAIIFIIVSLLPPTDGISLILMAAPLMLMFELTILFNRNKHQGRNLILT